MEKYHVTDSNGKKWLVTSEKEEGILRDYKAGVFYKQICKNNHCGSFVVKHVLEKNGLRGARRPDYSNLPKEEIIKDFFNRVSFNEMMKKYKCSKDAIYDIIRPLEKDSPFKTKKGDELDRLVIKKYLEGAPCSAIAKEIGRSATLVKGCLIRSGIRVTNHLTILPEDMPDIINRYLAGESSDKIAKDYDTVGCVIRKHLEDSGVDRRTALEAHTLYPINSDFFDDINNREAAYVLGWLWSDGTNKTYDSTVQLILSAKDTEVLEKIKKFLNHETKPLRFFKAKLPVSEGYGEYVDYCIYNQKISRVLNDLGMVKRKTYAPILDLPKGLRPEYIRHFLRGLIDGDGSVKVYDCDGYPNIDASVLGHSVLLETIKDYLDKNTEFTTTIRDVELTNPESCKTRLLSIGGNQNCIKFLHWLYKDKGECFLERKYQSYKKAIELYFAKDWVTDEMKAHNYVN